MNASPDYNARPSVWHIFVSFLRLGATAFGGPAMIVHIKQMAVERKGWLSDDDFKNGLALTQTIPGATAMQTAAYCGLRARGLRGSLAAYLGFGLPAALLMLILSATYASTHTLPIGKSIFTGLQVLVVALVAGAFVNFGRSTIRTWSEALICAASAGYLLYHGNPFLVILLAAALGTACCPPARQAQQGHASGERSLRRQLAGVLVLAVLAGVALVVLYYTQPRLAALAALLMRVDAAAFGGGFASVPLMLHEVVGVHHWMDARTFMDGIALGQVTPGPIVITAAFVGYQFGGVPGWAVGTIAMFTPSFLIMAAVAPYFDRLRRYPLFGRAITGILASFVGLLLSTTIKFGLAAHWSPISIALACGAFIALLRKVDVLWIVLAGALISAVLL